MMKLISDLIMAERLDIAEDGVVSVSGVMGSWVTHNSSNQMTLTSAQVALAYPVWNESAVLAEGTKGYTPDVAESGVVTVLTGHHRALTNQYTGTTPTVGDMLVASATVPGTLVVNNSPGSTQALAVCTKTEATVSYRGTEFTCIEYETI